MERESFVFYRSFYEAVKCLPPEDSVKVINAMCEYALNENETDLTGVPKAIFTLIKPQIDANIRRREQGILNGKKGAEYGKLGGRPKKETPKKPLENPQQNPQQNPQKPSNVNVNDNVNVNVNDNVNVNVNDNVNVNKNEKIYQQVADMYNDTCVSFPRLTKLSDSRKKAIKARLNKYSLADIKEVFSLAEESDFLKGANARNWSATFDWLMNDNNMAKVLDGNYRNKSYTTTGTATADDWFRAQGITI